MGKKLADVFASHVWGYLPVVVVLVIVWIQSTALGQSSSTSQLKLSTGEEIYKAACIACHGPGGKGQPKSTLGFETPSTFPDFSDCKGTTGEKTFDWSATIHEGGSGRGFSPIMPSFAEALTREQIQMVVKYLRTLCTEPDWPEGELNLPRALVTEKAFPEDETVITTGINTNGTSGVFNEIAYERRIGKKTQVEFSAPFAFQRPDNGSWFGGIGDLAVGLKRVLAYSSRTGSIFATQGEISLPTGNKQRDFGSGTTSFKVFGAYDQILPKSTFVQVQAGAELPTHTDDAPRSVFWRLAAGQGLAQNHGYGRSWTPMVELLADRDLVSGAKTNWDIVPQIQASLSKRQHITANVGVQFPLNNTAGRATQVMFYLLWDWFDGSLREGWK